jgi:hypothetical protein
MFHKNQPINAILHAVTQINFCPYFPHLMPNVRKIQYKLSEYNAIQHWLLTKIGAWKAALFIWSKMK